MKLHQTQAIVAKDNHRYRVINCGRRWGKTTLAVEEIKGKAIYKQSRIAYIAPTYQQARDIAWQMLIKEMQPVIKKVNESRLELEVVNKDGGTSSISLRGWENIETLRGQLFDMVVIDEIASMRNFESKWEEVVRPTLTDRKGEAIFISTPKGFNHFYELHQKELDDDDYKSYHFTSYDNPYIPKEELDKAREEMTEDRFAQEYMADFRKTQGLVYKEFRRDDHLFNEPGFEGEDFKVTKTLSGIDFGYTNPAAVLTISKDKDDNYWVMDEWYNVKRTDAQIAQYAASLKLNEYYPDPENPGGIAELEKLGANVRDVKKGKGSVENGINIVRELFKSNRLYIHESCKNLIWELETYSYPEKRPNNNELEIPIKENDHAMDALRYALMMDVNEKKSKVNIHKPVAKTSRPSNYGWANKR